MKILRFLPGIFILHSLSYAQDTLKTVPALPEIDYNPGIISILFKLILSLVIIIGLIYLSIFMLKRFSNRTFSNSDGLVKIIAKSHLTPKQSLFIVKLGLSYAVLGVSESSVNLIKELAPEEVESLKQNSEKPKSFQNVLKSVLKR
jgi:flagellar biosynthetic protein FliO